MEKLTHKQLVEHARKWLCRKHSVVITEVVSLGETPDALGWTSDYSTMIECKSSRSDFLNDAKKLSRRYTEYGVGLYRYYMTPKGLLKPDELPENWGLLEVGETQIREIKKPERFSDVNRTMETRLLVSVLRRIGQNAPSGVSIKAYIHETKNTASVSIESENQITD